MFCPCKNCRGEVPPQARYCPHCGTRLAQSSAIWRDPLNNLVSEQRNANAFLVTRAPFLLSESDVRRQMRTESMGQCLSYLLVFAGVCIVAAVFMRTLAEVLSSS